MQDAWVEQVSQFETSHMKQSDWCRQNGIPLGTFRYRLKAVKSQHSDKIFLEIKSKDSPGIKLRWGDLLLELDPEFDIKTLQRFLKTLHGMGRPC